MYTIKTVSTLTGLSTETLRAWERRYQTIKPKRDGKGRRVYSQDEVERLKVLYKATNQGFAISKITGLDMLELEQLLASGKAGQTQEQQQFYLQIVDALMHYRMDVCEALLKRAIVAMEPLVYVEEVLLPTLHKVGDLWHNGEISIAQEHLFSATVKRILMSLINAGSFKIATYPSLMYATLSGERHEFGILTTCLLAASKGCTTHYLGVDLPVADMLNAIENIQPTVLVISCINSPMSESMSAELLRLRNEAPESLRFWIGGKGGASLLSDKQELSNKYVYLKDLTGYVWHLQQLMGAFSGEVGTKAVSMAKG